MARRDDTPPLNSFWWREVLRAAEIAWVLSTFVTVALVRRIVHQPRTLGRVARRDPETGRMLAGVASAAAVDAFIALGPTFCKIGQMIASSPSMFPKVLADACLRTLDEVPPFPAEEAQRIVEQDLGRSGMAMIQVFDPVPLSAASIAQVHACTLSDGRDAVLKIQRPAIAERMNRDLRIMYRMAQLVDRTKQGHVLNMPGAIEDMHRTTNEELDFVLEAKRQTQFRENIAYFGDNRWVIAPEVYTELCGPRVICMERLYGVSMDRAEELRQRGVDGELVLRRGVKVWLEAALVHGPFHGDVHAGNLWVLDDGRAAYLDFGIMGALPTDHRDAVLASQRTAMIDGDYTRIVRAWQKIGILADDSVIGPVEEVAARLKAVVDPMLDLKLGEVSLTETFRQQLELQYEYNARAARELMLVTKQLMYFERYAKELAPDYNMARDLFLMKNVLPEEIARVAEERGIVFPADDVPHFDVVAADPAADSTQAAN